MAIESMYVFTGDEVIATDLPAKLNENFAKTEDGITNLENRVIPIEKGGTGATSVAGARNNLGLGNTSGALPIANGGTGQTTASGVRNALGLGNTTEALPIANGGTGANNAENARKNLGANDFVTGLSVSGKTITYNKKDGSKGTITTQDTVYTHPTTSGNKHIPSGGSSGQILRWSADGTAVWGADNNTVPARYITSKYSNGSNWYEVYNDGWVRQGGIIGAGATVTFLKPFKDSNYTLCASIKSASSGNTVTWAQGTPQNKKATSFQTHGNGSGFEWIAEGKGA